jgi:phosphoribosylformylglycinamidine synthase
VFLTNSLRFGPPESPVVRRLFKGVVSGIAHYGNCIGVPTVGGDVYFDESYEGNPLVNALCLGVLRHDQIKRGAAKGVGNPVYYVGAATGRDGLGGASFSSRELTEASREDRPAVQKGDPFMEKLLLEACLEAMEIPGLIVGIQDMGAAGLTCATCETASRGGTGIEIELDRVPQREKGLNSYQIMLSESQERMLVIVQKGREKELEAVFEKWDLHAAHVGFVTAGDRMVVKHHGVVVADIPTQALTDEAPVYRHPVHVPHFYKDLHAWKPESMPDIDAAGVRDALSLLLADPSVASKRWVWRQYDHMVQAGTVVLPGSDAAVVRVRLGDKEKYLAVTNDCNGRYCAMNPHRGGQLAVLENLRNLACAGARPLGLTDNLNFGNPHKPEVFHALHESIRGISEVCRFFDIPVVGGNVSLYNESPRGAIDPTPVCCVVGLIDDPSHVTRQFATAAGQQLVLLGGRPHELGASQFLKTVRGLKIGNAPAPDFAAEQRTLEFLLSRIEAGQVRAAHDLSEGGLLVAVAEMLFGPESTLGASLVLKRGAEDARLDVLLFGESSGRIVVAIDPAHHPAFFEAARSAAVPAEMIGTTTAEPNLVVDIGTSSVSWNTAELRHSFETSLERALGEGTAS